MKIIVDSRQMKQCDKNTIEYFGVPSLVLMERAALGVVEEIETRLPEPYGAHEILVVCGYGNNGGDGLAAARLLWQRGYRVTVVMPAEAGRVSEETKVQIEILEKYGIYIENRIPDREFDLIVDALFGIGLTRDLSGIYLEYVLEMNEMSGKKVAIDIPSGINADTGAVMGAGFFADITVTFAFAKSGLLLFPGAQYAGDVRIKEIGIDRCSFLSQKPDMFCLEFADLSSIPSRKVCSHKGSYGKVLTVAGQKNMAGAAFLSAKASYLTGAGLVRILTPEENRVILQQLLPEAILETYETLTECSKSDETDVPDSLEEALSEASVVVAGPGLGTGAQASAIIRKILEYAQVPVVLDADGLNIAAEHPEWLKGAKSTVIVTPHLGEMARLTQKDIPAIQSEMIQTAREFAKEYHVMCVLKDARTVIAAPEGFVWVNVTGNNGMATAGSGDVLTGILAGLIAQGMPVQYAASMGVYLHGLAGNVQVLQRGNYSLMARDILEGLVRILMQISEAERPQDAGESEKQ